MVQGLNRIPGVRCRVPEGAFYTFPNVEELIGRTYKGKPIGGSVQLSEILLEDFKLAAVPGEPFGAEGHLRFSFATSRATIEKGLKRLAEMVGALS
jgi:aspartate aminotransferase